MCPKLDGGLYPKLKRLAGEVAQFLANKQRDRFYYLIAKYTARYENIYPDHSVPKMTLNPLTQKIKPPVMQADKAEEVKGEKSQSPTKGT